MSDFTELPVYDGSGPYHLNRFRIIFTVPPGVTKGMLAADLVARFPTHFNSPYANVEFSSRKFFGYPTLKFTGFAKLLGINLNPGVHHDWVARIAVDHGGFTVQTLERQFFEVGDIAAGMATMAVNPSHFLAGRRAWRIDTLEAFHETAHDFNGIPAPGGTFMVLETAAIERFSSWVLRLGDFVVGIENAIPPVWIAMLQNFVDNNQARNLWPLHRSGASVGGGRGGWRVALAEFPTVLGAVNVGIFKRNFGDLGALKSNFEFTDVMRLFPKLLPLP